MAPAPAVQRKAVRRPLIAILAIGAILAMRTVAALHRLRLRLSAGDEGRQPVDVGVLSRRNMLRARLPLLRLMLIARVVWLRLTWCKRLAAHWGLLAVAVVVAVVGRHAATLLFAALLVIRLALAELLLRGCDQAEIMLGVLVVILRRYRISGTLRIAGKLKIFFGNM